MEHIFVFINTKVSQTLQTGQKAFAYDHNLAMLTTYIWELLCSERTGTTTVLTQTDKQITGCSKSICLRDGMLFLIPPILLNNVRTKLP